MNILLVSPTKSGVKNVVHYLLLTDTWNRTETTHLTLSIHNTPGDNERTTLLSKQVLNAIEPYQPLYLIYAVLYFWLRAYVHIWRHAEEYDVVWLHNPRLFPLLPQSAAAQPIVTFHGQLQVDKATSYSGLKASYYRLFGAVERAGIRRHEQVVYTVVSEDIAKRLYSMGVPQERTHIIWNAVDINIFTPAAGNSSFEDRWQLGAGPVLLYVGRLFPGKGVLQLLEAFAALVNLTDGVIPVPELVVVGNGRLREAAESFVSDNELGTVHFEGYIDHDRVNEVYTAADYVVVPSKVEGATTPLVLCEAFACGRPVFVSEISTFDGIADHECITRVDFSDPETAAAQFLNGFMDEAEWQRLSQTAREHAIEEFSWERRAEQYLNLFESVAVRSSGEA